MARFEGRQGRGAMRKYREKQRIQAELRNEEYQGHLKAVAAADLQRAKEEAEDNG